MIKNLSSIIRYFIFWYIVFLASRCVFVLLNWKQTIEAGTDSLWAFVYGFRLDIAMSCYVTIIPVLLWCLSQYFNRKVWINRILKAYTFILLSAIVLIAIADGELYQHWGQKLNAYASSFAKFPKEMLVFSAGTATVKLLLIGVGYAAFIYFLFNKGVRGFGDVLTKVRWWQPASMSVLLWGILFLGLRGGIGKAAINQSSAFFSSNIFLNHIAINATWNLMASIVDTPEETNTNVYAFTNSQNASTILDSMAFEPKGYPELFKVSNPNIVLVILEGWTADVIEPLGGEANVTPQFSRISKEGLLFTQFYANGNRTDKGLAAIISSQPALAHSSIINNIQKFTSLPSIPSELKKKKYHTSFYYGGASEFANMKGYWLSSGYEKIVDLASFSIADQQAEWGVHDDVLFNRTLQDIKKLPSPFFATILTLSSHEPFKVPYMSEFKGKEDDDLYRNAVKFSDESLGAFLRQAQKEQWYQNTVFIVLADHGHQWPLNRKAYEPERFRIPFLITGGALKDAYKGKVNQTIGGQVDLASLLLHQLAISSDVFVWSKNMLDSAYKPYATYTYNDGIGVVSPGVKVVFDQESRQRIWQEGDSLKWYPAEILGRAYEQLYFEEYRNR